MQIFKLLFLCTGNAARSVMAKAMLEARVEAMLETRADISAQAENKYGGKPDIQISSAGTLAIENLPSSRRVEKALNEYGLTANQHRSRQFTKNMASWADLIVGFEPHHIEYVRKNHFEAAHKTAMLIQLSRAKLPENMNLSDGILDLQLEKSPLESFEEVPDPDKGGDLEMVECARNISELLDVFWKSWGAKIATNQSAH